jgi:hypothetical protein
MKKRLPLTSVLAIVAFILIMLVGMAYFVNQWHVMNSPPFCNHTPAAGQNAC